MPVILDNPDVLVRGIRASGRPKCAILTAGNTKGPQVSDQDKARDVVRDFLQRVKKEPKELTDNLGLFGDGLELDSLEAAELSAMLEDELGSDPFSSGDTMPETVGEVLAHYEASPVT